MTKFLLSAAVLAFPVILLATPSYATKGIDAARACESNPKCVATYDDAGGVTILIGDKVIDCAGPQKECTVSRKQPGGGKGGRGDAIFVPNLGGTTLAFSR